MKAVELVQHRENSTNIFYPISCRVYCLHSSTMLTGGQLLVPFRVRLLGSVSFWPRRLVRSSAESTTGEISLAFGHVLEVRLSRRLRSGVPPFTPYKACLLLVMVGIFIVLLTRNCNINPIIHLAYI